MTATTRTVECNAETTLWLAFELGSTKWTLGFTTGAAQRPRIRTIPAGDLRALEGEIAAAKMRFSLAADTPVRSVFEAGRDGFWVHRWLVARGIDNIVVDSSSIEVKRRARHAKTDRLDVRKLLEQLLRWAGGARRTWSVVHVPTPAAEDARQLTREIETVGVDRTRVRNRIHGLLATQGVRLELTARFAARLAAVQTGDGRPFPAGLRERIAHEWAYLQTIEARAKTLAQQRAEQIAHGTTRVAQVARALQRLRAVGATSAALYSAELFGTRTFQNGRQVSALSGLAPVPYRSDQRVGDLGISKTSRSDIRRVAIQGAWCWLRWQRESALTHWFERRFAAAGKRARRIGIVAVARKLILALWRFVDQGVIPEGAIVH
jgi:transposase